MSSFYSILQFTNLQAISLNNEKSNLLEEFKQLGIDKIHFSGKYPTVFFKDVEQFDSATLKKIAEIHHKLWNYKKVMFLYVTSLTEIRIYNCTSNPFDYTLNSIDIENKVRELELVRSTNQDKEKLAELLAIFSASAIDSGSIWSQENIYKNQINIDKRIDRFLVNSLIKLAKKLIAIGLDVDIVHSLIMRSLFVMYLEDKEATPQEFYTEKKIAATSYFDLLDDKEATYSFFEKIQENFNGNIFPVLECESVQVTKEHLKLIKQCFINGDIDNETLFNQWRIFKFDIIEIELLSQIYETFLDSLEKKKTGSYYTPPELVELILNEILPVENETNYNIKILDPACGSGIFLVEAYKRIVQRWKNANPSKSIDFKTLKSLMTNNIYGVELNKPSIKVATFSLYLSLLDFLNPRNLWHLNGEKFPYLINDKEDEFIKTQGYNLFRTNTIEDNEALLNNYDIVVGNPPYGDKVPPYIKTYCEANKFAIDLVIPFIHKSTLLSPNGKIALLVPTKLLTNTSNTAQNFRNWLFNENYVSKVYNLSILRRTPKSFGGQLFSSAVVPASILFFQHKTPEIISETIEYWAPKTYIKNHIAEGVLIDSSDIKYLPRKECHASDTKIWKIAQWGSLNDFNLLKNLQCMDNVQTYLDKKKIQYGGGFQLGNPCNISDTEIKNIPHLSSESLDLYLTNKDKTQVIQYHMFHRKGTKEAYRAPHLLIKEGITKITSNDMDEYRIIASFLDYDCSYCKGVIGIHHNDDDILKAFVTYFNSSISKYFMFLTASTWGIERDVIKSNELFLLPSLFENKHAISILSQHFDSIYTRIENNYPLKTNVLDLEKTIDEVIFKILNLSINEKFIIQDTIDYTMDLFHKGHNSRAIKPVEQNETMAYAKKISSELNDILKLSELKVISNIYKTSLYDPLCLVTLQFIDIDINEDVKVTKADDEFKKILLELNQYTLKKYSKGIYVQKNLTYFDEDKIYIVQPNQKRFWTQSKAIEDAQNITLEIMSISE
ncbi:MAG: hypothetical protein KU29_00890 [Sulfurovum sp. FS06-10]|nr:MAG: hypothetical protein KU29_00890 [Sulfurovum sp. FS06-10]